MKTDSLLPARFRVPAIKRRAFLIGAAAALAAPYVALAASKNAKTDFGCAGNGSTPDLTNFQNGVNALAAAGGGTVEVPTGNYNLAGNVNGLQLPANVKLFGEGEGATALQAWFTDQSVVTINGGHSGLRDLAIFGKGTNGDPNPVANYPALRVTANSVESKIENVFVWGGSHAIQSDGAVDNLFYGAARARSCRRPAPIGTCAASSTTVLVCRKAASRPPVRAARCT